MKIRVGSVVVGLTVVVCVLAFLGCSRQQESSSNQLAGLDDQPNACTLIDWTEPLLDPPAVFYRSKGKPVTETVGFSVPIDGELCVVVSNGLHDPNQEDQPGVFKFEFHPYSFGATRSEEPEGIDIWDLDSGIAPGISGQIHVIMIDNFPDSDDLYFKHYTTSPGDQCKI